MDLSVKRFTGTTLEGNMVLVTDLADYQVGRWLESTNSTLDPARYLSCFIHLLNAYYL